MAAHARREAPSHAGRPAPARTSPPQGEPSQSILVITGGTSAEHEVSLASAAGVTKALTQSGYQVTTVTIARDGVWHGNDGAVLEGGFPRVAQLISQADVVFPVIHGRGGEDGSLAAVLELAGARYVGCGPRAGALGMDKHVTKLLASSVGVATAPGVLVDTAAGPALERVSRLRLPLFVKPNSEGSSFGVSRVESWDAVPDAVRHAGKYGRYVVVEQEVRGREVDVAVVDSPDGPMVSVPLEITMEAGRFFDFDAKYRGTPPFTVPAQLDEAQVAAVGAAARAVYEVLGCRGVVRCDFFLTEAGEVVLNEINTAPGMTEHSQVPLMFAAQGLSYRELVWLLAQSATNDTLAAAGAPS